MSDVNRMGRIRVKLGTHCHYRVKRKLAIFCCGCKGIRDYNYLLYNYTLS